jgi:ABC-type lipoprotein export system ATPase subunit
MIVAIFGPQSSGKSTLLKYALGCDFMSSARRCTKGIYGTYYEISNKSIPKC